jgi:hypothetical protein
MRKLLSFFFPKNENIFVSIITFPLKLINTFITIICYVALSPIFLFNFFVEIFCKIIGKVVGLFRSKV